MGDFVSNLMYKATIGNILSGVTSWAATLVYIGIIVLTLIFLIMYIKRMITIAFLVLISPIITITYSIDKIGDGKSQALDTWMREFLQNVLIQPFHCIIYLVFISVSLNLVNTDGTLASGILVIITMFFIFEAEKIIKNIFGINAASTGNGMKTALTVAASMGALKKLSGKAVGAVKKQPSQPTGNSSNIMPVNIGGNTNVNPSNVAASNLNEMSQKDAKNSTYADQMESYLMRNNKDYAAEKQGEMMNAYLTGAAVSELAGNNPSVAVGQVTNGSGKTGMTGENKNGLANATVPSNANANAQNANNLHTKDEAMPMVENRYPKNRTQKTISGVRKYGGKALKFTGKALKGNFNQAMAFTAMAAQGISGDDSLGSMVSSGIIGYEAGKQMSSYAENKMAQAQDKLGEYVKKRNVREAEQSLANAYSNYKNANNLSTAQMDSATQQFMKMNNNEINDIQNQDAQTYAKALHAMPNEYANAGFENPNQEMQNTLANIRQENMTLKESNAKMAGALDKAVKTTKAKYSQYTNKSASNEKNQNPVSSGINQSSTSTGASQVTKNLKNTIDKGNQNKK